MKFESKLREVDCFILLALKAYQVAECLVSLQRGFDDCNNDTTTFCY